MQKMQNVRSLVVAAVLVASSSLIGLAQRSPQRILQSIDEQRVITLRGNVHTMARTEFDQGPVDLELQLDRMVLQLEPSAAQQAELDALVEAQHDPNSPLYHQWLSPSDYGARFGTSAADLARITAWLAGHGFRVDEVAANHRQITFSGTAGQVRDAFHTEIRNYRVNGVAHIANSQDPQIPAAFAGVVGGVVSLHNFRRNSMITSRTALSSLREQPLAMGVRAQADSLPQYSSGSTHYIFPADWATIYDLNSLYGAGTNGKGVSIAIVGRSSINLSDVTSFRSDSGLVANNPNVIYVSSNPGLLSGDQDESTLDVEWAGAVAPSATVNFVIGASTNTTDGIDLSAQYVVNHASGLVVSTSYGSCEQEMGSSEMSFYNGLWQQAASQGISVFVSSGDAGAAGCYGGSASSASGTGVNGLCTSPYSTCVGGTEFHEGSNSAQYWSASNSSSYESALSYIPEVVWNESGSNGGSGLWSSGGGISTYYSQPGWQSGVSGTAAANGKRAVPDVSMTAAGHDAYIIVENGGYYLISGTSAASPSFAGVMALVAQARGVKGQGNANPTLYSLLNASHNPFHATPSGNNSVPGVAGFSATGAAYNMASGLGSVDGAVLVSVWPGTPVATGTDFSMTTSAASGTVTVGKSTTFTVGVSETGSAKNAVTLTAAAPTGVTATISPASITPGTMATVTVAIGAAATVGAQVITITGTDSTGKQTATYTVTVVAAPTLALSAASSTVAVTQGSTGKVALTATAGGSYTGSISFTLAGLPTGVTATWSANPIATSVLGANSQTLTLTAAANATVANSSLTITAAGDGLTASQTVTLQVTSGGTVLLTSAPTSVSMQSLSSTQVTVTATPTGSVTLPAAASGSTISVVSGLPKGFTATWSSAALTSSGAAVWTLTLKGSSAAVAGSSTLNVSATVVAKSGTSYNVALNLPFTVTLTTPTLTATPASTTLSVMQGTSVTDSIALVGNGTLTAPVSLAVSGLPTSVTGSWSNSSVTLSNGTGASILTLSAGPTAPVGSSTITVTATANGVTATKQITVQVQSAPSIQLSTSTASVTMASTATSKVTVTATPGGGLTVPTGAVGSTISVATGLPKGVTATWSAPTLTAAGTVVWTLTLTGSVSALGGSSTLGLSAKVLAKAGIAYSATATLPLTLTTTPPTLSMAPASTSLAVMQGSTVSDAMALTGNSTFVGVISMSVSGLPSGVTASWNNSPVTLTSGSGSSTLTLTASAPAVVSTSTITVIATGDGLTVSKQITLQVQQAPSITLATSTTSVLMQSTASSTVAVTAIPQGGMAVPVGATGSTISVASGLPKGVTATFSAPMVTAAGAVTWTLTLTGSATAGASSSTLSISARVVAKTGVAYIASQNLSLTISVAAPTLTISTAASSMTVINPIEAIYATQSVASLVLTVTGGGSFQGTVSLSMSGLPPNMTAKWSSNPVILSGNSGSSTLTVTAGETNAGSYLTTVTPGTYTLTITATGNGLTVTKSIVVNVQGITVNSSVNTLTIHRGNSGSFTITTTLAGGANGVAEPGLSGSTTPNGITISANPGVIAAPGSGSITFTFKVSSTATLTSYQLLPAVLLLPSANSTTPTLVGWSTGPVTVNIVQ